MHPLTIAAISIFGMLAAESHAAVAQERDRAKIPEKDKWNLAELYPTDDAWKKAKENLRRRNPGCYKIPRNAQFFIRTAARVPGF